MLSSTSRAKARLKARLAFTGATVVLLVAAVLGIPVLRDEWLSARMEAIAVEDLGGPDPLPWEAGDLAGLCAGDCPPRGLAARGVHLSLEAALPTTTPAQRTGLLNQAKDRLTRAIAARPASGGWLTWLAYDHVLAGDDVGSIFSTLARSYAAAGFLPQEGPWRTRYCGAHWRQLSPWLRAKVLDEMVWLRDVDPDNAAVSFVAFNDPDAAAAVKAAWARPPAPLIPHRRSGGPGGVHLAR